MELTLQVIEHFDKEDEECGGDYHYVTIELFGSTIKRYEDYYHDKGEEKADAWVDGFAYAQSLYDREVVILPKKLVNDSEYS